MNKKTYILIIPIVILIIKFIIYLFQDEPYPASLFDKELITDKIILNVEDDNIDTIIEAVNEHTMKLADTDRLISIEPAINIKSKSQNILRYTLEYVLDPIEDYRGYLNVICYFIDTEWVIKEMEMIYSQTESKNFFILNTEDAKNIYYESLSYLESNNSGECDSYHIKISTKYVYFTLFGINENGKRCIIKRMSMDVKTYGDKIKLVNPKRL